MNLFKKINILFLIALTIRCEGESISSRFTACDKNKITKCSVLYQPVCGFGGDYPKTFTNGCIACSHPNIYGYQKDGECTKK